MIPSSKRTKTKREKTRHVRKYRPRLEILEDRILPANLLGDYAAILLLDPSSSGALNDTGNGKILVTGCGSVVVDSNNAAAAVATGKAQVIADEFDIVGQPGTLTSPNASFQGIIHNGVPSVDDPLALLPVPDVPSKTFASVSYSDKAPLTLSPGTYQGGIKISGQASVTLLPGIYYMQGGGFSVTGQAVVSGDGVMIYNAPGNQNGTADAINITGAGAVQLTPPTSGIYQGITLFQERGSGVEINLAGNGNLDILGTIYAPGTTVRITGNGGLDSAANPQDTIGSRIISQDLNVSGNGSAQVSFTHPLDLSESLVPGPVQTPSGLLVTNIARHAVEGVTKPWSTVDLESNGDTLFDEGQTTVDDTGQYSFTVTLAAGLNNVQVRSTDDCGRQQTDAIPVILDTTPPQIAVNSPSPGLATNQNITISGQVTDDLSGVASLEAAVDGGPFTDVSFDANGNFAYTTGLALDHSADGSHTIHFRAMDYAGNLSPNTDYSFLLDTVPPQVSITAPQSGVPVNQNLTVTGLVTDDRSGVALLQVALDSGSFAPVSFDSAGHFTFTTALPLDHSADGDHTIHFQDIDQAGNISQLADLTFTLDTVPPTVAISSPNQNITADSNITIAGSVADDRSGVSSLSEAVDDGPFVNVPFDGAGDFSITTAFPLDGTADGKHVIHFQASDRAGNVSAATDYTFDLETCPPSERFGDWVQGQDGGSAAGHGYVDIPDCGATMHEGDSFDVTLRRTFTIPADASFLTFAYSDLAFDTTSQGEMKDAFEAALVDGSGSPLVHTIAGSRDAFFNVTEGQVAALGNDATADGQTVSVDLSQIPAGTEATLIFRLVNNDSDVNTSVTLDDVQTVAAQDPPATNQDLANVTIAAQAQPAIPTSVAPSVQLSVDPGPVGQSSSTAPLSVDYAQLPLSFEANQEQADPSIRFLSHANGFDVFLMDSGNAVLNFQQSNGTDPTTGTVTSAAVQIQLVGANPGPSASALDPLPGLSNYIIGNDPTQWQTGISTYERVRYENVYPGIDLIYHGNRQQLEYDFQVAAGADPSQITLQFDGADSLSLDSQGDLVVHTSIGDVVEDAPQLFQEVNGVRQAISGGYVLLGDGTVGFSVGAHDTTLPLTIDPVLTYSTFLGGSGNEEGYKITVDASGYIYVTGYTLSTNFPVADAFQSGFHGTSGNPNDGGDAFIAKLTPAGNALVYSTYLGGSGGDLGSGIAVDADGNAYIDGTTDSRDFPTLHALQPTTDGVAAFYAKLNATGTLVYSTYLGSGNARGNDIALDDAGNIYLTGQAESAFPTVNAAQPSFGGGITDAFVAKINPSGSALVYSTFLGGAQGDYGFAIAVDPVTGSAYVAGETDSTDFPTVAPLQARNMGSADAFLAKLDPNGSISYSTYLGGGGFDRALGVAVDVGGDAYVAGWTLSSNFPTRNAIQSSFAGGSVNGDAFVTKIDPATSKIIYSTYLGSQDEDLATAIGIDATGAAYVPVNTRSGSSAHVALYKLDRTGTKLLSVTPVAGGDVDRVFGIHVTDIDTVYLTGRTSSPDLPTVNPVQAQIGGGFDVFIGRLSPTVTLRIESPGDGTVFPAGTSVVVSGAASAPVSVDGKPVEVSDANGDFFTRVLVEPGQNVFHFLAKDALGQTAAAMLTLQGQESAPGQIDFSQLNDVSASFVPQYGQTSFNEKSQTLFADVAIRNAGQYPLDAPLLVGIKNISDPNVRVRGAAGVAPDGTPFYDFTSLVSSGRLNPGGQTGSLTVSFYNPDRRQFTYDLVFLGQLNRPPEFTSLPKTEALVGRTYQYAAAASDPDNDPLTFSLVAGPPGMIIDHSTGSLSWTPLDTDVGTQIVTVRVSDGRGGSADQRFTLSINTLPANRPPFFTSVPVVNGNVNTPYIYQAAATDPDADPLTFSLLSGPSEMMVDATTGVISWTPDSSQLGGNNVSVEVSDGRGGTAVQSYTVQVAQEAGNYPPVIISEPVTTALAGQQYTYPVKAIDPDSDPLTYFLDTSPTGMAIDSSTGLLTWNAPSSGLPSASVSIRVRDGRGGFDTQDFVINVSGAGPGEIHGTVFNDLNANKLRDFTQVASATVPGTSDPYLAGMPAGSTASNGDVAPGQSPSFAGFSFDAGDVLTFNVTGSVNFGPSPSGDPPDGDTGLIVQHVTGNENGVSNVFAPANALMGVFLGPNQPSLTPAPATLDFTTPASRDYLTLSPTLQQTFFIGDGITSAGQVQSIVVPVGATRLYLGSMDGFGWYDNYGAFSVSINVSSEPGLPNWTVYLDSNNNGRRDPGEPFTTTDADGNYSFTNLAPGNYVVADERQPGWLQTAPTTGSYALTVAAGQVLAGIDFGNQQSTTATENQPPSFTSTPPTTATVGQLFRYNATAFDPDFDPLSFDLVVKPAGMGVDPTTGTVVWVPTADEVGPQDVTLRVQDGRGGLDLQSFQVNVARANTPPVITSVPTGPAVVGAPWLYQVLAQDAENDPLTYNLDAGPAEMTLDPVTHQVTWTPSSAQVGSQHVAITVSDGRGGSTTQSFDLPVVATAPDDPPSITSTPRTNIRLGDTYQYAVLASDPNGDPLTFSLPTAPGGMTIDPAGLVTWQPTSAQFGSNQVQVRVDDGRGGFATQTFTINVVSLTTNHPPSIISTPPLAATVGRQYAYNLVGSDPDGDPLQWSLEQAPAGMSIDANQGTLRWVPTSDQIGSQNVVVRLVDGQGGFATQSFAVTVRAVDVPPVISSTPPTQAVAGLAYSYAVLATDADNDPLTFSLTTSPVGMTIDPASGLIQWRPTSAQVGSFAVALRVDDGQGGFATQTYTVVVSATAPNQPPYITSTPSLVGTVGTPYQYNVAAVDPEGQSILFSLQAGPAGMTIDPLTGILSWTPAVGQDGVQGVTVAAIDPLGAAGIQSFSIGVNSDNLPPTITSTPVQTVTAGLPYRYDVQANDADGDPLTYRLERGAPAGMTLDQFGRLTWLPAIADIGTHRVGVTVDDGRGVSVTQIFDIAVLADQQTPRVSLLLSSNPATLGSPETFLVNATDNVGVASLALTINGNPVPLDSSGRVTLIAQPAGDYTVVASASDAAGNTGLASTTLSVIDTSDVSAPTVDVTSPTDGAVITAPVDVIGTASDANLLYYTLSVGLVSGGPFTEIFRGTTSVTNGVLGQFDPSGLANDSYILRLTAVDAGGNTSTVDTTVSVAGDLKLGNFRLSFTDLTIPVSGIPLTVSRTYDSLNAGQNSEMGYGWRLEFRDTNLHTSLVPSGEEDFGIYTPFRDGTRVYLTLPGGKREGFTFTPRADVVFGVVAFYHPAFTPDPGVTDQLSVPDYTLTRTDAGDYYGLVTGGTLAYNPADALNFGGQYFLTTKDGLAYTVDAVTGELDNVADTNGNTLTFTDAAVTSSAGPSVTFSRDPQGRITAVTDPMGNQVHYAYDAKGDLVSVTDRQGNVTQFVYAAPRPHYLTSIIDPLGRTGVRTEYDDQGRLIQMIDAAGKAVQLAYDPTHSTQTVVDALGNPTTFEYDERGNVVTQIDAMGGITRRTYDVANNMLTETDPLGHTTSYTYDASGNVLTVTDPLGNVTRDTYTTFTPGFFARLAGARAVTLLHTETDPLGNTTTNDYDSSGNLIATTDAAGNQTRYVYDSAGQQTSITDPAGNITQFEYDARGNMVRQTDALGHVTSYTYDNNGNQLTQTVTVTEPAGPRTLTTVTAYDANGRPTAVTDAEGNTTHTEYDALGHQTATVDALGRRTQLLYDDRGELIETDFADGTNSKLAYDDAGHRISSTDRAGRVTYFQYDALGRLITTIYPDATPADLSDNPRTSTEYDAAGHVTAQVDELGNRTEFTYDAAGKQIVVHNALGQDTTTTYDAAGRTTAVTDPLGHTTRFTLDPLGRQVQTLFADGTSASQVYDSLGRVISQTDQAGVTTRYEYDPLGRLTAVVDALSQRTEYAYDEAGNLVSQKDANGHITQYQYDGLGRRTATILPLGQESTTVFDAVGNVQSATDFNDNTIQYQYDSNNRLTAKLFPDGTSVTFTYTPTGQRATETDARGTTSYQYDERDRLLSRTDPDGTTIRYTYDAAGNRTSVAIPAGITSYTFDALGRMATVTDPAGGVTRYTYDAAGNLVETDLPNGTVEARSYDVLNRLVFLENIGSMGSNVGPGAVISSYQYTLGPTGIRTDVVEDTGRKVHYDYDALYRLIGETITDPVNGDRTIDYTYDPVGNRLTRNDSGEGLTSYTYDANDRLLTEDLAGQIAQYTYDNNGNTLSRIKSATDQVFYQWDFENRMIGADVTDATGTKHITNQYNADGIRVSQSVDGQETRFLIDANRPYAEVLMEYRPSGLIAVSYVYGNRLISQDRSGVLSYYHVDGLGSTRALTDANGNVTDRYTYDAFGRTIGQSGSTVNSYLFAGEQRDGNVGLDYLRARFLDFRTGRFYAMDPFGGLEQAPDTRHRFLYSANDPINATDPSGRQYTLNEVLATETIADAVFGFAFPTFVKGALLVGAALTLRPAFEVRNLALNLLISTELDTVRNMAVDLLTDANRIISEAAVYTKLLDTFADILLLYKSSSELIVDISEVLASHAPILSLERVADRLAEKEVNLDVVADELSRLAQSYAVRATPVRAVVESVTDAVTLMVDSFLWIEHLILGQSD
jgi:RHS repeat-associated protein